MKRRQSLKLISSLPLLAAFPSVAIGAEKDKMKAAKDKMKAGKDAAKGAAKKAAKGPKNLISETDTLAKAMQYKHDATKAQLRTDKKAICGNCAKYNLCMDGDTACKPLAAKDLKTADAAPCQIFKAKIVKKDGWCLSWQAKG